MIVYAKENMDSSTIEVCSGDCEVLVIHPEKVADARKRLPDGGLIQDAAEFFKVLGDPTRIKILNTLAIDEMCVCDISAVLDMSQSAVSHQLRILKQARMVRYRKDGKVVYYSLDDSHVSDIYLAGLTHVRELGGRP